MVQLVKTYVCKCLLNRSVVIESLFNRAKIEQNDHRQGKIWLKLFVFYDRKFVLTTFNGDFITILPSLMNFYFKILARIETLMYCYLKKKFIIFLNDFTIIFFKDYFITVQYNIVVKMLSYEVCEQILCAPKFFYINHYKTELSTHCAFSVHSCSLT